MATHTHPEKHLLIRLRTGRKLDDIPAFTPRYFHRKQANAIDGMPLKQIRRALDDDLSRGHRSSHG